MAGNWNTTGSSTVMIFFRPSLVAASAAYSVVDLPDPVGPVTSTMPFAWAFHSRLHDTSPRSQPSLSRHRSLRSLGLRRLTLDSPSPHGTSTPRISTSSPPHRLHRQP